MKLYIKPDAVYLVLLGEKSRFTGYFYLHSKPHVTKVYAKEGYNLPIHIECITIKNVVSLAAEAEYRIIYHNSDWNLQCISWYGSPTRLYERNH